jgi:hypothetical protein
MVKELLPGRGREKIIPANDVGDACIRIVYNDRELVGRRSSVFPYDEIATNFSKIDGHGTADKIEKRR